MRSGWIDNPATPAIWMDIKERGMPRARGTDATLATWVDIKEQSNAPCLWHRCIDGTLGSISTILRDKVGHEGKHVMGK